MKLQELDQYMLLKAAFINLRIVMPFLKQNSEEQDLIANALLAVEQTLQLYDL